MTFKLNQQTVGRRRYGGGFQGSLDQGPVYNIQFNGNGGGGPTPVGLQVRGTAPTFTFPANTYEFPNRVFYGWSTDSAAEWNAPTGLYAPGSTATATQGATYYAIWKLNAPTQLIVAEFDLDNRSRGEGYINGTYYYGGYKGLPCSYGGSGPCEGDYFEVDGVTAVITYSDKYQFLESFIGLDTDFGYRGSGHVKIYRLVYV